MVILVKDSVRCEVIVNNMFLIVKIVAFFICIISLSACSSLSYYTQAVHGHYKIMQQRESIERVISKDSTSANLKADLEYVLKVRDFASEVLLLPDNRSYRTYVDLGRNFVVWNIVAAPEFSLEPQQWCFFMTGCLKYKGYFSKKQAVKFANELIAENLDVYQYGVSAYSTLGWFSDPMLNTMLSRKKWRIAEIIFHELAHQKIFVQDDIEFNEAFATAVQELGVEYWFDRENMHIEKQLYLKEKQRYSAFVQLVNDTYVKLDELYKAKYSELIMRQKKAAIFAQMRQEFNILKSRDAGFVGYSRWFDEQLNNAKLISIKTYRRLVPFFKDLYLPSRSGYCSILFGCFRVGAIA